MKIQELIKMVDESNKLMILVGERRLNFVTVTLSKYGNSTRIKNLRAYKKFIKDSVVDRYVEEYLNCELTQDSKYPNYFRGIEELEVAVFEDRV